MSAQGKVLWRECEAKDGRATCMAGCIGRYHAVHEDGSGQADIQLAKNDDRAIVCGGEGQSWPALCVHAWNEEHAGAVVSDGCGTEHQAVGGCLLVYAYKHKPCQSFLIGRVCQRSERAPWR